MGVTLLQRTCLLLRAADVVEEILYHTVHVCSMANNLILPASLASDQRQQKREKRRLEGVSFF